MKIPAPGAAGRAIPEASALVGRRLRSWQRSGLVLGMMGFLISQSTGTSVTGRLVWTCTYQVAGTTATVVLDHMCPISMEFQ